MVLLYNACQVDENQVLRVCGFTSNKKAKCSEPQ